MWHGNFIFDSLVSFSLQKKRSTISTVELNILDLYLLKTRHHNLEPLI